MNLSESPKSNPCELNKFQETSEFIQNFGNIGFEIQKRVSN